MITSRKNKIAFGYVRVSTEEQTLEGISLDAQRAKIQGYCELHGISLARVFEDAGISGKGADNRPGLLAALQAVCRARGVLAVYSLSRLARSTRDAIDIAEKLRKSQANLASVSEKIDTTSAIGEFFFTLIAALAQLERDQISERTKAGLAHKRSRGERISRYAPYGFTLGRDGTLVPDGAEQQVVQAIITYRQRGQSYRQIGRELEAGGIRPRSGGKWHPKVLASICDRTEALTVAG